MSAVNVSYLQGLLFRPGSQGGYDIDGNGVLDRPELAKASLNLMGQDNPNDQAAGRLLATFVEGGRDGKGLLPDYNGDGSLSRQELYRFAGGRPTITSQNFQQTFGDRYQPGGSSLDIPELEDIGRQNLPKFSSNNPEVLSNSIGSLLGGIGPRFIEAIYAALTGHQNYGGAGP